MLVLDEYKMQFSALNETLALAHKQMNADALNEELKTLEAQMGETAQPQAWRGSPPPGLRLRP